MNDFTPFDAKRQYDAVIVGAGPIGTLVAQALTEQGKHVLILEAGRASGLTFDSYRSYVNNFYGALAKTPNAPYPQNAMAPSPLAIDVKNLTPGTPDLDDYQVELGPLPFGSTYQRSLGGTMLHWLALCPRMVPNDFRMQSTYGVGVDWPVTYDDLAPHYCDVEWKIGVAGDKDEQERHGITFPPDYDYPMERIPPSWSDQQVRKHATGRPVRLAGKDYPIEVTVVPSARNSIPRRGTSRGDYHPVPAVGTENLGERCEGNASCIPICPIQAKYTSLKTLNQLDRKLTTLVTQAVVTEVTLGEDGNVNGVVFNQYPSEDAFDWQCTTQTVKAKIYVLAAHSIENAKILLASGTSGNGIANSSDQVGRNLMDHPYFITWGTAPKELNLGQWRGPGTISEIPTFRDGAFRSEFAAMRTDLGNWGWDVATFPPAGTVLPYVGNNMFGKTLRKTLAEVMPHQFRIGYVIEQLPEARNRVTISRNYMGPMDTYRPVLNYDISDYTKAAMLAGWEISRTVFTAMGVTDCTQYTSTRAGFFVYRAHDGKEYPLASMGSGHHMGTHRMGVSRTDSVVDRNQRSWDHENLYIVGCGSFPTSATSNPTLSAAALALMSAKDMLKRM